MSEPRLSGRVFEQRYELSELLGSGGLGEVYRATHLRMGKAFAVKVLHPHFARRDEVLARFDREAQVLSRLSHPACVQVTDYGVTAHGPYLVMELIAGETLGDVIEAGGVELSEALDIIIAVLSGLEHAHGQGIVHRDLKPHNIMLVTDPLTKRRVPKILDFGLARLVQSEADSQGGMAQLTKTGIIVGTPSFMAPEQITPFASARIGPHTDIYAVGVLLYELCTGERPFDGEDIFEVLEGHLRTTPRRPREIRPELPAALDDAVMRALEKKPEDRWVSAVAFAEALQNARAKPSPRPAPPQGLQPQLTGPSLPSASLAVSRPSIDTQLASPRAKAAHGRRGLRDPRLLPIIIVIAVVVVGLGGLSVWLALSSNSAEIDAQIDSLAGSATSAGSGSASSSSAAASSGSARRPHAKASSPSAGSGSGSAKVEPPPITTSNSELPPHIAHAIALWQRGSWGRRRAAAVFQRHMARYPNDARSAAEIGRLYLQAFWGGAGLKALERALRANPRYDLGPATLIAVCFAMQGGLSWRARRLLERQLPPPARRDVLLAAASIVKGDRLRARLLAHAKRLRVGGDAAEVTMTLEVLARTRGCAKRREALATLAKHRKKPLVRALLSYSSHNDCLGSDAKRLLN